MPGFKKWSAEDDTRIRELHAAGEPLSTIAVAMGLTGGQVRGRVWKLKLVRRSKVEPAAE